MCSVISSVGVKSQTLAIVKQHYISYIIKIIEMKRKLKLSVLAVILITVILLFISGSSLLVKEIFVVPFGNILVWIGLMAWQIFLYILNFGFKKGGIPSRIIRAVAISLIFVSISWFLISFILSGNVNFNFSSNASSFQGSPNASILYWNLIYTLIVLPIVLTLIYQTIRIFNQWKIKS